MDPLTHVAAGVLLSQVLPAPSRGYAALAGIVLALLPDLDYFLFYKDRLAFLQHHRGFTHSLVALPLFALGVAAIGQVLGGPRWFKPLLVLAVAVLASHLLLDLATPYGTQLLSPFSRGKFALDWVFIIDPLLTAILLIGAVAPFLVKSWGSRTSFICLVLAMVYVLICGCYHHQAQALAHRIFQSRAKAALRVAALPQPFSCRRWHLIAADGATLRQTFVALPWLPAFDQGSMLQEVGAVMGAGPDLRAPAASYTSPRDLVIHTWRYDSASWDRYAHDARQVLHIFLDFSRFPLLLQAQPQSSDVLLTWVDLRFTVPSRPFPFVLQLHLDQHGRLQGWFLGHGRRQWFLADQGSTVRR